MFLAFEEKTQQKQVGDKKVNCVQTNTANKYDQFLCGDDWVLVGSVEESFRLSCFKKEREGEQQIALFVCKK